MRSRPAAPGDRMTIIICKKFSIKQSVSVFEARSVMRRLCAQTVTDNFVRLLFANVWQLSLW